MEFLSSVWVSQGDSVSAGRGLFNRGGLPLIAGQDVVRAQAEAGKKLLQALRAFAMTLVSAVIASP